MRLARIGLAAWVACCLAAPAAPAEEALPKSAHNLLVDADLSGNLSAFSKNVRGKPIHVVYDLHRCRFTEWGPWNEYGVGLQETIGVVPEDRPAFWMAEWPEPVKINYIRLSGAYTNQPQPQTGWKIEVRRGGKWLAFARGKGGWYNGRQYRWGGLGTKPIEFDAFRVSLFSKDKRTPLKSIHFRGEDSVSWVVGYLPKIDAEICWTPGPVREGRPVTFTALTRAGKLTSWEWDFGAGPLVRGRKATHAFTIPGLQEVKCTISDGAETAFVMAHVKVHFPIEARIAPLTAPVIAGRPVDFAGDKSLGKVDRYAWDFGDGRAAAGAKVRHTFAKPGTYKVKLTVRDAMHIHDCLALVRVHTPQTVHVPAIHLDTDPSNGQDDQHCLGYALFSELDVLGVNSIHHGGGQESVNRQAIEEVLRLAKHSGLPLGRTPLVFSGSDRRLYAPPGKAWADTEPEVTPASQALLGSARGASPGNPVWWVSVGATTNLASALLQARAQGLDLKGRVRILWVGGSKTAITGQYNGDNDPWAAYVMTQSGIETWVLPDDVAAGLVVDKRTEAKRYPAHRLGRHLLSIQPDIPKGGEPKPLYDPCAVAAVISRCRGLRWVKKAEPVGVGPADPPPPDPKDPKAPKPQPFAWIPAKGPSTIRLVREIDVAAMKRDLFRTLNGKPVRFVGIAPKKPINK